MQSVGLFYMTRNKFGDEGKKRGLPYNSSRILGSDH